MVETARGTGGQTMVETRPFIPPLPLDARRFAHAVHSHQGIGNQLDQVLDVTCRYDCSRVRKDFASNGLVVMKQMAMNLSTRAKKWKSIRVMRGKTGWNDGLPLRILGA